MGDIICGSNLMAEAEAMRTVLMACVELGFKLVQLETDSKVLVEMLIGVLAPETALEGIAWDMNYIRQQLSSVAFLFTPRACNWIAHQVTSHAKRVEGCHMLVRFEAERLFNTLASDINISVHL